MKALLLVFLVFIPTIARAQTLQVYSVNIQGDDHFPKSIRFFCTQKYPRQRCVRDAIELHLILGRYPVANLGSWNFALASSDEWTDLVRSLGGITGSPAFSVWETRTTVLEEALFSASGRRRAELIRMFGKADGVLLEEAVSHELGHVLCGEFNENRAAQNGQDLFADKTSVCHTPLALVSVPIAAFAQSSAPLKISTAPSDKPLTHGSAAVPEPDHLVPNPGRSGNAEGVWDKASGQRFFCNTGYELPACLHEIAVLQKVIRKYPTNTLVGWSWILVKSEDWKLVMALVGVPADSPAFTCLELRETFIEEALVADTGARTGILMAQWHMNARRLLEFAVAHELGHGLCNNINEEKANNVAKMLQARKTFSCVAEPNSTYDYGAWFFRAPSHQIHR